MPFDRPFVPVKPKGDQVSLVDSFRRLAAWLREHDAMALMQSLSPGAKPIQLSKLEQKLGFPVPAGLRALWLMHDGQRRNVDSLVGSLHLLPVAWVLNERPATLKLLARARADAASLKQVGLTAEESASDAWFPVASRGSSCVIVHSKSGRVFAGSDEAPYLHFVAASVPQWLSDWVDAVELGQFELVLSPDGAFFAPPEEGDAEEEA